MGLCSTKPLVGERVPESTVETIRKDNSLARVSFHAHLSPIQPHPVQNRVRVDGGLREPERFQR